MRFIELKAISKLISSYRKLHHIKRVKDNLIKLEFSDITLYMDMTRGESCVFISSAPIIAAKNYAAPFDIALSKLNQSTLIESTMLGDNRILRILLVVSSSYKQENILLQCEFCGKHTNIIILNDEHIVIEALRHISTLHSSRPVRVGERLKELFDNPRKIDSNDSSEIFNKQSTLNILEQSYKTRSFKQLSQTKQTLIARLTKQLHKLDSNLASLPSQEELIKTSNTLNKNANLLLANIFTIKPYQTSITLRDFNNIPLSISLKATKTPQEAINAMFKESKKIAKKAANIHIQAQNLTSKIDFLHKQIDFIKRCENLGDIAVISQINDSKRNKKQAVSRRFECVFIEGFKISIGRNERENELLLQEAKANDLWLHIKDFPSSHMIIHCGKQRVEKHIIYKAGEILLGLGGFYGGDFFVDYTRRKFVKILQGANVVYAKYERLSYRI